MEDNGGSGIRAAIALPARLGKLGRGSGLVLGASNTFPKPPVKLPMGVARMTSIGAKLSKPLRVLLAVPVVMVLAVLPARPEMFGPGPGH